MITLALISLPHLGTALSHLQPLRGKLTNNWVYFVNIVLALSGVEAVANTTSVMKLDPRSSSGVTLVPVKVIKHSIAILAPHLAKLFNHFI